MTPRGYIKYFSGGGGGEGGQVCILVHLSLESRAITKITREVVCLEIEAKVPKGHKLHGLSNAGNLFFKRCGIFLY